MHQLVHHKGGPGHIPAVLEDGDDEIEDEDIGQEDDHGAHTADDTIGNEVLEYARGHVLPYELTYPAHEVVYPVHGILPDLEGGLEHEEQDEEEDGVAPVFVSDHGVDALGKGALGLRALVGVVSLLEGAGDEAVLGVDDGRLAALLQLVLYALLLFAHHGGDLGGVGLGLDDAPDVAVVLQELDGEEAERIVRTQVLGAVGYGGADAVDGLLKRVAVVDMDVAAGYGVLSEAGADDRVKEVADALGVAAHGGYYGRAEHRSKGRVIELVAALEQFVVHVERYDHGKVHVDELHGEVEVSLQVRPVHYVDDDVRGVLDKVLAHIELLGAVGREGICAGEIDDGEVVAGVVEVALLGVDSHAGVIAHMFVAAGGDVEERCLAAVGIAYQRDTDMMAALLGQTLHELLQLLRRVGCGHTDLRLMRLERMLVLCLRALNMLLGLALAQHFDHRGFLTAEGYFVTDYLVDDGVAQRGFHHHLDHIADDKAHLNDALAEAAVTVHFDDNASLAHFQV